MPPTQIDSSQSVDEVNAVIVKALESILPKLAN